MAHHRNHAKPGCLSQLKNCGLGRPEGKHSQNIVSFCWALRSYKTEQQEYTDFSFFSSFPVKRENHHHGQSWTQAAPCYRPVITLLLYQLKPAACPRRHWTLLNISPAVESRLSHTSPWKMAGTLRFCQLLPLVWSRAFLPSIHLRQCQPL